MSRYIDADRFIDYLGFENTEEAREEIYGEIVTLSDFDNQPTADVKKVKHGKWLDEGDEHLGIGFICSSCGKEQTDTEDFRYCPWCGAKMDL